MQRYQDPNELAFLLEIIQRQIGRPEVVLEIGVERMGTITIWHAIAYGDHWPAKIIGVDMLDHTGGLWQQFPGMEMIWGDSHDPAVVAQAQAATEGKVDFLFLDGDHSYEGIKADFENYWPMVRPGGMAAFHDFIQPSDFTPSVQRFFFEQVACGTFARVWVFADFGRGGIGIGVKAE